MAWPVFMVEQTTTQNRYLRRFTYGERNPCPEASTEEEDVGHEASSYLDTVPNPFHDIRDPEERRDMVQEAHDNGNTELLSRIAVGDLWPHYEQGWPAACAFCGYEFTDEDEYQLHQKDLWTPADPAREETFELARAPVGALWDAWWCVEWRDRDPGPDGRYLVVKLPDGFEWQIDGKPTNAPVSWERQGKPPNITVNPSIASPGYHGFLVAGELTDDLEGRSYDGD